MGYLQQEIQNYVAQVSELEKTCQMEIEQRNAAISKEQSALSEKNREKEHFEKEIDKIRKEKKENEKNYELTLNELKEVKISTAL